MAWKRRVQKRMINLKKIPPHCKTYEFKDGVNSFFTIDDDMFEIYVEAFNRQEALMKYNDLFESNYNFLETNQDSISDKDKILLLNMKAYIQTVKGYIK